MTNPSPSNPELLPVIQADRDAAKSLLGRDDAGPSWWSIDSGNADNDPLVQAFASVRIASEQATVERIEPQRSNLPSDGAVGELATDDEAGALAIINQAWRDAERFDQPFFGEAYEAPAIVNSIMRQMGTRLAAGREADAKRIEALEGALRDIEQADVGLQALDESYREKGQQTPWVERANYFRRQVERRRGIARQALSPTPGED